MLTLAILIVANGGCSTLQRFQAQQQTADARALTYDGLSALDRGQADRASKLLTRAVELSPQDHRVHEHLAKCHSEQGDVDQAITCLQQAVELSSNEPRIHVQLGHLHLEKNQPDLAIRHAQLALKNDRRSFEAWKLLGLAQAEKAQLEEGLSSLHRALTYNDEDPEVSFEIARIYHAQGRNSRALAAIESMRTKYPADREPLELLTLEGGVLLGMNRPQQVISRLARISERDDFDSESLLVLCRAYKAVGDFSNARLAAALATDKFPGDRRFAMLLSDLPSSVTAEVADSSTIRR